MIYKKHVAGGKSGNVHTKTRITKTFTNAYPQAKTQIVTPENYVEFLSQP